MKTGIVLQARNGSTRFPYKMVADINGRKSIEWLLKRLEKVKVNERIVATSWKEEDRDILKIAEYNNWKTLAGDPEDVLSRYAKAVEDFSLDLVVRITGDCPLIDPELVQKALSKALEENVDYLVLTGIIDGFDVEVIKGEWILKAHQRAKLPSEREHVSPYISKSKKAKKLFYRIHEEDLSHIHLSLDYPEDLVIIERIIKTLGKEDFTYEEVVKLIKEKPEILKREKEIPVNEGYLKSLRQDRDFIRSLKAKPLKLENNLRHFEKTKTLIPNCSQTFSKSYLQFSVGAVPLFVKEGKGCYLTDLDENTYIDYTMGLGACILGYAFEPVIERVEKELRRGTVFTLPSYLETELAELLRETIPCCEMARFGKNGSDVTSAGVRLARAYTGRKYIACCGYHGWQDWYIGTTTRDKGIPEEVKSLTLTFEYNNIQSLERLFEEYEDQIACVIMEPVGVEEPKEDFLQKVRELTQKHGALLIFDEVVSGFRFSLGGAQEYFGVVPDLACFGKAMGNGMPISAIVGRSEIMELFEEVFFSFTFGGETASIVSAIATIQYLKDQKVIPYLWEQGKKLKQGIQKLIEDKEMEDRAFVKGYDVRFLLDFVGENSLKLKTLFQQESAKRGILFTGSHNMALPHDDKIIEKTLEVYDEVLDIVKFAVEYDMVDELIEGQILQPVFRKM
ncbi:aminotransferase class III-fold pyridoxal phosphate-dependent enzyme [Pampinifervens florentissimum]|uniref:aminotransferase class III-fold pyridoxal phosphate-dependent enzyme n=1 Tax=Pampinifervens florentissimum TaxID=1632019 RepID=UPI0013B485F8|nr:aminotransferase class III-fold pyridoxal phosphate-dependent enzyme [Hydrogenobacter sp. T-8]QID32931.1 aminotransferase class III-fold pyridoxal phosphate-dependent enzyme [Hydrogenobacter sp. T-8]